MADGSPSAVALLMAWLEDRLDEINLKTSQIQESSSGAEFNEFQPSVGAIGKLNTDHDFLKEHLRALKADHPNVEADFATTQKDARIGDEDYSDEIDPESTDPSMLDFAVSLLRRTARGAPPIDSRYITSDGDHFDQSRTTLLSQLEDFVEEVEFGREDLENKLREGRDVAAVVAANKTWFERQLLLDTFKRIMSRNPSDFACVMAVLNGSNHLAMVGANRWWLQIFARHWIGVTLDKWFSGIQFTLPPQEPDSDTTGRGQDPQNYIFELFRAASVTLPEICHGVDLMIDRFDGEQDTSRDAGVPVVSFLVGIVEKMIRDRTRQFTSDEAWTAIVALRCACIITVPQNVLSSLLTSVLYWSKDVANAALEIHSQLDRLCNYTMAGPFDCQPEMHKHIGEFPSTQSDIELSSECKPSVPVYVRPWGLLVRYDKEIDIHVAHKDMVVEIGSAVTVCIRHNDLESRRKLELSHLAELLTKFPRATIKPVEGQ